jgi:RNA polymerase sigma-70 factor, ECF subfamily
MPPRAHGERLLPEPARPLRVLRFEGDEHALVQAILAGHGGARAELYDRYAVLVRRVLARVLGVDQELADVVQEVFVRALGAMHKLELPERLGAWLTSMAVFTARGHIRARRRRRWLRFGAPEALAEASTEASTEAAESPDSAVLEALYRVLDRLPEDERIVLVLRHLEGMELRDVAAASGLSLATVKRRLARASARFEVLARRDPQLRHWAADVEEP